MHLFVTMNSWSVSRVWVLALLALGPSLSLVGLERAVSGQLLPQEGGLVVLVVLLAWSPLFFSVPALLTQDARDSALPGLDGVVGSALRGVVLLPWLLLSSRSRVRLETAVSLLALLPVVTLRWDQLLEATSLLH